MDHDAVHVNCNNFAVVVHRHVPMKLGLNEFSGYNPPKNQDYIGPNFMFFGFIPASLDDHIEHGLEVCTV